MAVVDLSFPLHGKSLPADHGYHLFASICRRIDGFHSFPVGVHPVTGIVDRQRRLLHLTDSTRLTIRLDHTLIGSVLPLAGGVLEVSGHRLRLGIPQVRTLHGAPICRSRIVTIKGFVDGDSFLEAVWRQLEQIGVSGNPRLLQRRQPKADGTSAIKRTLRIRDKEVVGYAVEIDGLTEDHSIRLQEKGLGGRRHFGCGIFLPVRENNA